MKTQQQATQSMVDLVNATESISYRFINTATPLMDHQVTAAKFVLEQPTRKSALLALDMGTGKTATAVSLCLSSIDAGMRPVLVVCPPSMRLQFTREFARFAPSLHVETIQGTNPKKAGITAIPDCDVIIAGDSSIVGWMSLLIGNVKGIILDECQRIKDKRAKRSNAVLRVAHSVPASGIRVAMSGTPLIATPMHLVAVIDMLQTSEVFGGIGRFIGRYAPKIDQYGSRGTARLEELHDVLCDSFMLRMRRDEVLELPNHGRITRVVELESKYSKMYKYAEQNLYDWLKMTRGEARADKAFKSEALSRMNELRRLAGLGKIESVIEYARELLDLNEQVFITCAHTEVAQRLCDAFKNDNCVAIVGGMNDASKMDAVDRFQSGDARVLVGNITASSVGLTLTSARHHISAELPWSSIDLEQCEARISRNSQTRETVSSILLGACTDGSRTIDERVFALLEMKHSVVTAVLDGKPADLIDEDLESIAMAVLRTYDEE